MCSTLLHHFRSRPRRTAWSPNRSRSFSSVDFSGSGSGCSGRTSHSSSCDWLVVSCAKAQYQGSGKINNAGNYGFIVTVIDGQASGGGGVDKIRMKIWDKNNGNAIVYDNQMGASDSANPTTAISGGSIVLHN